MDRRVERSRPTARGDAVVFFWMADDPTASLRALAASADPFDAWLRDEAASAHPVPLEAIAVIAARNTRVAQYPHWSWCMLRT